MTPGEAITIKRGDNSALAFYRSHCVKDASSVRVWTWCGLSLAPYDVAPAGSEQPCAECMSALMEVER